MNIHRIKSVKISTMELEGIDYDRTVLKVEFTDKDGNTHVLSAFLRHDAEVSAFDGWLGDGNDD